MQGLEALTATKLDALRGVHLPGYRLIALTHAIADNKSGLVAVDFGTTPVGLIKRGWMTARPSRNFDRDGNPRPVEIVVAPTRGVTAALLATVRGFVLLPRGADEAPIHEATLVGRPELLTEPAWRLRSTGRLAGTYVLSVDVDNLLLASGDNLLLIQGGNLLLAGGA
jgi:hypothetical protein